MLRIVKCDKCGTANNTSDMGYCWQCKAPLPVGEAPLTIEELASDLSKAVDALPNVASAIKRLENAKNELLSENADLSARVSALAKANEPLSEDDEQALRQLWEYMDYRKNNSEFLKRALVAFNKLTGGRFK